MVFGFVFLCFSLFSSFSMVFCGVLMVFGSVLVLFCKKAECFRVIGVSVRCFFCVLLLVVRKHPDLSAGSFCIFPIFALYF